MKGRGVEGREGKWVKRGTKIYSVQVQTPYDIIYVYLGVPINFLKIFLINKSILLKLLWY